VSVTALRDAQDVIIGYLLIGTELKAGALQSAIFNSAKLSSIATDAKGASSNIQRRRGANARLHSGRSDEQNHPPTFPIRRR